MLHHHCLPRADFKPDFRQRIIQPVLIPPNPHIYREFAAAAGVTPSAERPALESRVLLMSSAVAQAADADVAGEWMVTFQSPRGPLDFTMYVLQDGRRLTGRLSNENGEFPLRGSVDGPNFTITWSFPDTGGPVEITFTGTVDGDKLSGSVKAGSFGSFPFTGTRTA